MLPSSWPCSDLPLVAACNPEAIRSQGNVMGPRKELSCGHGLVRTVPVGKKLSATGYTVTRLGGCAGELSKEPCQGRISPVPRP